MKKLVGDDTIPSPALPSVDELYRRYSVFAGRYFEGHLPPLGEVTIEWSRRMTSSAGLCRPQTKIIRLSVHYHLKYPDEIDNTLLHEMIHLIVPNHGPMFYAWLKHIQSKGGHVSRYSKGRATPANYRWRYSCRRCGIHKDTKRRYADGGRRYRCGRCKSKLIEQQLS